MRNKIIILIQVLLVIIFLQSSFAQHFFSGAVDTISQWYEDFMEVPERRKIMQLRDTFLRNNMALQPHQVDYIMEVTDTQEKINDFYWAYCLNKDKNPFVYGNQLEKFCGDLAASELLTTNSI